ncbi:MAG: signal peptide peptidase SppA [Planctomycetes bacterium]|nr:signal peptide peptidase SppA [Planctomycetota bacterium]
MRRLWRGFLLLLSTPLLLLKAVLKRLVKVDLLVLTFKNEVPDFTSTSPLQKLLARQDPPLSLGDAIEALDEVAAHGGPKGVLIRLERAQLALVQAEALVDAFDRVRRAGIKIAVWGEGLSGPALMLTSAADEALGATLGSIEFLGVRVRNIFVHDLLGILGVVPLLHRHGDYKSMADMFNRQSMSPAHREMSEDLARDLHDQLLAPVIMGRPRDRDELVAALDDAPLAHEQAVAAGILDGVAYRDELQEKAAKLAGVEDPTKARALGVAPYLARAQKRRWRQSVWRDLPLLRVIDLRGAIKDDDKARGCAAPLLCEALDEAREDSSVRAVVLRIDSPGGSVLASERIWRCVKRLDESKPVVASMGRVAASGGYYAAAGARTIVAHAGTLTGSIGVVSGKMHIAPALARWGVSVDGVQVGARAGMLDPDRGWTPEESEAVFRELMRYYETFLERVAKGRKRDRDQIDAVAQGRVYTGRTAQGLGLVDQIGGLRLAIELACQHAELDPNALEIERIWPRPSRGLVSVLRGATAPPWAEALGAIEEAVALTRVSVLAYCPLQIEGI